ncbi:hypothetical protein [Thiothrix lacustris]|uniref:hypothetical protein n=1 Tax=Thiothrix lacustris TaxID=525917 RepID=UPI00048E4488|nr:hypothetical protein [Thiothrix lacustris]
MSKYAPLTLRTIAAITSATSAAAAHPAAANLFGMLPGGVMVASSAAAIYAGWHIVATSENTDHRIVSGVTAALFAGVMTVGIHSSGQLKNATQATSTAEQADTLYMNQESTRMATLATVAAELRATQKSKYPAEYAALQAQVDKLSTPTVRTATATQEATATTGSIQQWIASSVFEIVTPALLLLAGMFSRRKGNQGQPLTVANFQGQPQGNPRATQENQPLIDVTETEGQPVGNPLEALEARAVALDAEGNVTVNALVALTRCTPKQARTAFAKATEQGILTKTGEGGATRYRYSNKLRIVK